MKTIGRCHNFPRFGNEKMESALSTYNQKELLSASEAARRFAFPYGSLLSICRRHRGFAVALDRGFLVPAPHMEQLLRGSTPAEIAAAARGDVAA